MTTPSIFQAPRATLAKLRMVVDDTSCRYHDDTVADAANVVADAWDDRLAERFDYMRDNAKDERATP